MATMFQVNVDKAGWTRYFGGGGGICQKLCQLDLVDLTISKTDMTVKLPFMRNLYQLSYNMIGAKKVGSVFVYSLDKVLTHSVWAT